MPSHVPRDLEPYKKRELLERRVRELRHLVKLGGDPIAVVRVAAKVKAAKLAVIKAQRLLIADKHLLVTRAPDEQVARQLVNLQSEESKWQSISDDEIVAEFGEA